MAGVLIVDDAAFMRMMLRKIVEKDGMTVLVKPFQEDRVIEAITKILWRTTS